MPGSARQPKYRQILQTLLCEIDALSPGTRLPGVSAIAQRFGVARATAERVLNELARQGYVHLKAGSGTYVADRRVRKIVILSHEPDSRADSFYGTVSAALIRQLQDHAHHVQVLYRDEVHGPALWRIRQLQADAYATIGIMNAPYLEQLAQLGRIMLAVDYRPMSLRIDSVSVASMRSAYLATRGLHVAGRKRLCYLGMLRQHGEEEADATAQRIGFERAHIEAGLPVPRHRILISPYDQQIPQAHQLLQGPDRPDGLVCFDEPTAETLCRSLGSLNLRVPDDVAIIACGGQHRRTSVFLVDPVEMGRVAARLLSERLARPDLPVRDYAIWPDYHDAGTVPPAATQYIRSLTTSGPTGGT